MKEEIYTNETNNLNKAIIDLYAKIESLDHYIFELENRIKELEKHNI